MKKIVILLMLGLVLFSGCSRKDKEESVLFDKMFTEYTEQVNCSGDFGFHASFQVHRENTIFDYSDLVLLLSYGNKTLHMPLFRADPVISSNGTTVQLTSNELKFSEPGSIFSRILIQEKMQKYRSICIARTIASMAMQPMYSLW